MKNLKRYRLFGLLLCLSASVLLLTTSAALADGGVQAADKVIMLGSSGIENPLKSYELGKAEGGAEFYLEPSDYIYFGNKDGTEPIKWRVLSADKANDDSDGIFLLSEYPMADSGVPFDKKMELRPDGTNPNVWQGSNAQRWCRDFAGEEGADSAVADAFSKAEFKAVLPVTKTDAEFYWRYGGYKRNFLESKLQDDRVFFLSAEELSLYVGSYSDAPGIKLTHENQSDGTPVSYWLRSPGSDTEGHAPGTYAGHVWRYSGVNDCAVRVNQLGTRPALNLALDSILFTTAAEGAESSDFAFVKAKAYTGNAKGKGEWKLTLKDDEHSLNVAETSLTAQVGGTLSFNYTDASVGEREQLFVLLVDSSDEVLYYASLKDLRSSEDAQGSISGLSLPAELGAGNYTLKFFSVQCNGPKKTDFASAFDDVSLTVLNRMKASDVTDGDSGQTVTASDEDGYIDVKLSGEAEIIRSGEGEEAQIACRAGWGLRLPTGSKSVKLWEADSREALEAALGGEAVSIPVIGEPGSEVLNNNTEEWMDWPGAVRWYCYEVFDEDGNALTDKVFFKVDVSAVTPGKVILSFDAGGGSGTMAPAEAELYSQYTLPECTFTAPEGKEFCGWDRGQVGSEITIDGDLTLKAQWKDVPVFATEWCFDETEHWHRDANGNMIDVGEHEWVWVIIEDATAGGSGIRCQECKICGYRRPAVSIPPTGISPYYAKTGNDNAAVFWSIVSAVSLCLSSGLLVLRKKGKLYD